MNTEVLKGLPEHLKDPKHFKGIEKTLFKAVQVGHKHKTVKAYLSCAECSEKRIERQKLVKTIGFKSYPQYLLWRKIMDIIINKRNV